jgi:RNA polymerase sigma factor (TIGR02999 family)
MPNATPGSVTVVLASARAGDPDAPARLFDLIYAHLRRLAADHVAAEFAPLGEPTSVLHDALLEVIADGLITTAPDRAYFFAAVSRAIRRVLVDHARARLAVKRGGGRKILPLDALADRLAEERVDAVALRDALDALEQVHARSSQVITLRTLGGFTAAEVAEQFGVSLSTVEKDTQFARAWLHLAMGGRDGND